jgi:TonB family protein
MSSGSRVRTVSLAGFVVWAGAAYTGRAMPAPQDPDWLFCGRLLSLTCASRSSDARLLLEASEGNVLDVWISAPLREDLMARLGERDHERNVCVARNAAPALTNGRVLVRNSGQLTVRGDPGVVRRGDVFSTCDQSLQLPTPVRQLHAQYTSSAMRARVDGTVMLHGIVEADGHVSDVRVVRTLEEGLDMEAQKAFAQWQFRPALRMGEPVAVAVTAEFAFHMAPPR